MSSRREGPIVSLLSSATEILHLLGLTSRVAAVSHECDWPPGIADRPRATRSRINSARPSGAIDAQVQEALAAGEPLYEIDEALLRALRPELIVTQAQCDVCAVRLADVELAVADSEALSATQIVALAPQRLEHVLEDVQRVADAAGVSDRGHEVAKTLKLRLNAVRELWQAASREPVTTACIEWTDPLMLAANWVPDLIEAAGGRHPLTRAGRHSTFHDWGEIRRLDPEALLIMPCGLDAERAVVEAEPLRSWPGWEELRAVQTGRVWAVDGNAYFNRSGPRLIESVEILAGLLHPGLFPSPPPGAARRVVCQ